MDSLVNVGENLLQARWHNWKNANMVIRYRKLWQEDGIMNFR